MKQKRLVSMIGALIIMISAVVLITGCPQPNNKKDNTTVNNNGNNNLNGTAWFESGYHIGYYFLDGKVYAVDSSKWEKSFSGTYSGNNYTSYDGTVIPFSISGNILKINDREFLRVTDSNTLEKVKTAPIV